MRINAKRLSGWFQARDTIEIFIFITVLAAHLIYVFSSPVKILDWYPSDDAFYYFKTAQNIAEGRGVTFDGITRTNGFHPLWMAVNVPVFALARFDLILPLRALILVLGLLNAGSGVLVYRLGNRFFAREIAAMVAFLWVFTPEVHALTARGGMESGISAFFIFLLWERATALNQKEEIGEEGLRQLAVLGLIGGFTILSRLDNVFLVFFAGLWVWLRLWRAGGEIHSAWGWRVRLGLAYFGPIAIIMLAYLAWNYVGFGTFTPVSGQVKTWWGELEWTIYGVPVRGFGPFWDQLFGDSQNTGPFGAIMRYVFGLAERHLLFLGDPETIVFRRKVVAIFLAVVSVPAMVVMLIKRNIAIRKLVELGLPVFLLGFFAQYTYYYVIGYTGLRFWYWVIAKILILFALLYILGMGWAVVHDAPRARGTRSVRVLLLVSASFILLNYARYIRPGWQEEPISEHVYIERANWLEDNTPPGAVIATSGSGNIGYFTEGRSIVNMDGLMNSSEYLQNMRAGTGADYLEEIGVQYVYGNQYNTLVGIPYGAMLNGKLEEFAIYKPDKQTPRRFLWRFVP